MIALFRTPLGKSFVVATTTLVAFVFIFYGVFAPKNTRGLHPNAVAGTVNGVAITIHEFNQELNRRMEFYRKLGGGQFTEEQIKRFRIKQQVFQELAERQAVIQATLAEGLEPPREQIRRQIKEMQVFQKNGQFDYETYKRLLEANQYTPGSFEKLVRDDLLSQLWQEQFKQRVQVTPLELKEAFLEREEKRMIQYALLNPKLNYEDKRLGDEALTALLADPERRKPIDAAYEMQKITLYKDQTIEAVERTLAREHVTKELEEEDLRRRETLASKIIHDWKKTPKTLEASLKKEGLTLQTSSWMTGMGRHVPGVGEVRALKQDTFKDPSPIDLKANGAPGLYTDGNRKIIAVLHDKKHADLSQLAAHEEELRTQLFDKKVQALVKKAKDAAVKAAKIEGNPAVVGDEEDLSS
jgi:hypothetical protein